MSQGKKNDIPNPKLSVRFGPLWPLVNEYEKALQEMHIAPALSSIVREALEIGLLAMIDKLPPAQRNRVLKAKPAAV